MIKKAYYKTIPALAIIAAASAIAFAESGAEKPTPISAALESVSTTLDPNPAAPVQKLIRDGFSFPNNGMSGIIKRDSKNNKWYFTADTFITDGKGLIKPGTPTEILPSSTLEKIILTIESDPNNTTDTLDIKLWGKITRYTNRYSSKNYFHDEKGKYTDRIYTRNYIFPANFNKLKSAVPEATESSESETQKSEDKKSIIPSQARDIFKSQRQELSKSIKDKTKSDSIIPDRIIKKFKLKKVEDLSKWKKGIGVEADAMLSNRTGFFVKSGNDNIFVLDALGRNVEGTEFKLLPCETLQWAQKELTQNPGRLRYKVSGIITKFKGSCYLLLQRSARTYNHGNFAR